MNGSTVKPNIRVSRVVLGILAIVILVVAAYLIYALRWAAIPEPQGPDGHVVKPLPNPNVRDEEHVKNPKRLRRHPKLSVESLESDDASEQSVENWDAVLTLAELSSEAYSDDRVHFAKDVVGFDVAVPVDQGARHSLVSSNSKVLVVAFRGTHTISDILLDGGVVPIRLGSSGDGFLIHSGFRAACNVLYDRVLAEVDNQGGRNKRLIVTGHSLGGAMAVVFAYRAKIDDNLNIKSVVTFGQPLVANQKFADELVNVFRGRHRRFVHRDDLVSRVARPYFHSGSRILLAEDHVPQFWRPEVLIQAPAPGIVFDSPNTTSDPEIIPLSDEELAQVRDYAKNEAPQNSEENKARLHRQLRRLDRKKKTQRSKKDRPDLVGSAAGAAVTGAVTAVSIDWIAQGLEDHKMEHYINCIESIEIEIDE